jgi:hypothetical protein
MDFKTMSSLLMSIFRLVFAEKGYQLVFWAHSVLTPMARSFLFQADQARHNGSRTDRGFFRELNARSIGDGHIFLV